MKAATILIPALLCLFYAVAIHAQVPGLEPEHPYSLGGYVKFLTRAAIPEAGDTTWDHLLHQRFNFEYRWSEVFSLSAGMRNRLFWGDSLGVSGFDDRIGEDPGYADLTSNWLNEDDFLGNTTFDRIYLDWRCDAWEIRAGRQRINWGMTTLWNPNDLFNVYSIFDFDYEERPGTDAVLISHNLGYASRAEVVWALGDDWDETSLAARFQFNTSGFDVQFIGGKQGIDHVLGAGLSGSLWDAGVNAEISHFDPYVDDWEDMAQKPSTVATIETEYNLSGKGNLSWKASVLYTSNPQDPTSMLIYLNQSLTARTISFTRWTGYGDVSFDISSLSRQSIGVAVYDDESWYLTATHTYSLADDWQLMLVWQHYDGPVDSLFGKDPSDMVSGSVRWSF